MSRRARDSMLPVDIDDVRPVLQCKSDATWALLVIDAKVQGAGADLGNLALAGEEQFLGA